MLHPSRLFVVTVLEVVILRLETTRVFDTLDKIESYCIAFYFQESQLVRLVKLFQLLDFTL